VCSCTQWQPLPQKGRPTRAHRADPLRSHAQLSAQGHPSVTTHELEIPQTLQNTVLQRGGLNTHGVRVPAVMYSWIHVRDCTSFKHNSCPHDARAAAHFSARDSMSTRACAASSGLRKRRGDAGRGASGCGSYSGSSGAANRPTSAPMPLYGTCAARPAGACSGAKP